MGPIGLTRDGSAGAMLPTETDPDRLGPLLDDDAWVMEQKHDGTRALARTTRDGVLLLARDGSRLRHSAAVQHEARIGAALAPVRGALHPDDILLLDGEVMLATGEFRVWDIPSLPGDLAERRSVLERLPGALGDGPVRVVPQAVGAERKRSMLRAARESGAEGVVLKRLDSHYEHGARTTAWLKAKFVRTADLVVVAVDRPDAKHGRFRLAATGPDGRLAEVGGCSAIGKPEVAVGDVIEVAYLYWTGERIYQPRMVRPRPDRAPSECLFDQFATYTRDML